MKFKTTHYNSVSELIKMINDCKTVDEGIALLKRHDSKSMRYFINAYYNKDFSFMKGDIDHDYTRESHGMEYSNINGESSRLEAILRIGERNQKTLKLCEILLECVAKEDADLIKNNLFNKEPLKINKRVFKAVYPQFFRPKSQNKEN